MDNFIYIADDFFFLCIGLLLLYLFILAVASHFKHSNYPKARKQYQCAILVPYGSLLPSIYQQEAYEFITYKDLLEAIDSLDKERYELVILLSDKAGIQAMQLHTIINNRKGVRKRFHALSEEINNSLFRSGNTQIGFSSSLFGTNMAFDLEWLQKNQRTAKTNLERKLFKQNIYIEYLPDVIVHCDSAPVYPYRRRIRKTLSYLLPSLLEGNWNFCNRIAQQLIPSPMKLCTFVSIWTLLITGYHWTSSLKWWILLLGLAITYSLAIPNYLVEDKKKQKYSIWRKGH